MQYKTIIKLFAGDVIKESKLNNDTKIQLLNYVKESDVFEVMNLLNTGQIKEIEENQKPYILKEFKNSDVPNKVKHYVKLIKSES